LPSLLIKLHKLEDIGLAADSKMSTPSATAWLIQPYIYLWLQLINIIIAC